MASSSPAPGSSRVTKYVPRSVLPDGSVSENGSAPASTGVSLFLHASRTTTTPDFFSQRIAPCAPPVTPATNATTATTIRPMAPPSRSLAGPRYHGTNVRSLRRRVRKCTTVREASERIA